MALEVCRICGGNTELKSILDQGPEMKEKLEKCANVQVFREDSLPNFICQQCDQHLDLSYKLIKQSEETARRLKKEMKIRNQPDVEETESKSNLETATSSILFNEEIKANQQYASIPSWNQSAIRTSVESSSNNAYKKENKPIYPKIKIEPSEIDEEEFQLIDNSNLLLANDSNNSNEVYGSLEAYPPSITPAQNDIKIEEVRLIPPDQISMDDNDGNDAAEENLNLGSHSRSHYETGVLSPKLLTKTADPISSDSKKYTCNICEQEFTQLDDLKRHMELHSDEYSYTCTICCFSFRRHDYLEIHVKENHPKINKHQQNTTLQRWTPGVNISEENQCDYCGKQLKSFLSYKSHIQRLHPNEEPPQSNKHQQKSILQTWTPGVSIPKDNQCNYCGKQLKSSILYNIHMQSLHPNEKPPHKCKTCNKEYYTLKSLTSHERIQHSSYNCDICSKSFKYLSHLTRHEVVHSKLPLQHSCSICAAKFGVEHVYMCIHTTEKQFKCDICSKDFAHPDLLKRHAKQFHSNSITSGDIKPQEKYKSQLINEGDRLEDPAPSNKHVSNKDDIKPAKDNPENDVVELTEDDHKKYSSSFNKEISWDSQKDTPKNNQCGYCGKQFKTLQSCKNHSFHHTKNKLRWTPGVNIPEKNQCGCCGRQLTTSYSYQKHLKNMHPNVKPSYRCKPCNKKFYTLKSLALHEGRHHYNKDKHYKCDICVKSYKYLSQLTRHEVLHSELPLQYSCSICLAEFRLKHNLNVHMRIHSKLIIKCGICSKVFSRQNTLKNHTKKMHSNTATSGIINPVEKDSELPNDNLTRHERIQHFDKDKPYLLKRHTKKNYSDTATHGIINPLEKYDSELIKDNQLEHDYAETFEFKSNISTDFSEESKQQLPSTSKTQIGNTECSISPLNIVKENSNDIAFSLPMENILKDALKSSASNIETNFIDLIKVEEYQIKEQNVDDFKNDKPKLSSIYNTETFKFKSNISTDFSEESKQQLPSTSKTQIENTECSISPPNIVKENSNDIAFSLPMENILKDALKSSASNIETNFIDLIKVEEYQIKEQNVDDFKNDKPKLSSIYNIEDFI